jgi:hypothetical protein
MTRLGHVCGVEFLALASPARLNVGRCRVAAAMAINWALAVHGRPHPAGEVVVGFGSDAEVGAAMARARAEAKPHGELCATEYCPQHDTVRVAPLREVAARGLAQFATGANDPEGWFPVAIGPRGDCLREATRLRRVRAGHRSQERRGG